jgi:hypothetical protein
VTTTYTFTDVKNSGNDPSQNEVASVVVVVTPTPPPPPPPPPPPTPDPTPAPETVTGVWVGPTIANSPGVSGNLRVVFGAAVGSNVNFTATWTSNGTTLVYNGTASGTLGSLAVNATSATLCGGDNNPSTATSNTFTATMTLVDATHITGTYSGVACTINTGTFTLVKQS